jgi:hypothetical protein
LASLSTGRTRMVCGFSWGPVDNPSHCRHGVRHRAVARLPVARKDEAGNPPVAAEMVVVKAARLCRWAAVVPVTLALILLATDWPGLDVRRQQFRIVISYTDPARATAVLALIVLGGVSLIASIALEVQRLASDLRRLLENRPSSG